MKKMINSVHLEGKLYEHDLAIKTVQNKESSNYGKEYIAGTLNLATDEDCLNIVKTHFTFVTEYTTKGSKNNTFTTLKSIIENGKTVVVNGKDEAMLLAIDTATALNDFYTPNRTTGEEELVSAKKCEGGFVKAISELNKKVDKRNLFIADILINGTRFVEADEEHNIDEHLVIKGAIFNFRNAILPVEFVCYDKGGIQYFESLDANSSNLTFTKVWGHINSKNISNKRTEESAFGAPQVIETTRNVKEWVIDGTSQTDAIYAIEEDGDISPEEIKTAMADREKYLAETKKRNEEYQASRAANANSTSAATPASSAVSAAMGGFNF